MAYLPLHNLFADRSQLHAAAFLNDIDRYAASVLNGAAQAVQAVLDRRAAMDEAGKTAETLYVYLGEVHPCVAHKVAAVKIIEGLRAAEPSLAVSIEQPHNFLAQAYNNFFEGEWSPALDARVRERDRDGVYSLMVHAAYFRALKADMSDFFMYGYFGYNAVAVRFTDVAYRPDDDEYLDSDDPSTMNSITACDVMSCDVAYDVSEGTRVRNHHMTEQMISLAGDQKSRIVVHHGGGLHLVGDVRKARFNVEGSLTGESRRRGLSFMIVPFLSPFFNQDHFPPGHALQDEEVCFVEGLPDITAAYASSDAGASVLTVGGRAMSYDLCDAFWEAACLNGLLHGMGLGRYAIGETQRQDMASFSKNMTFYEFCRWQREDAAHGRADFAGAMWRPGPG